MMLPYLSVTEFLVCLLLMVIVVLTCSDLLRKIEFGRRHATNTPVVPYIPLIGSIYPGLLKNPLVPLLDVCKDYTSFYVWLFTEPYYVTCDPDELQIILTHRNSTEKANVYKVLHSLLHDAIVLSPRPPKVTHC